MNPVHVGHGAGKGQKDRGGGERDTGHPVPGRWQSLPRRDAAEGWVRAGPGQPSFGRWVFLCSCGWCGPGFCQLLFLLWVSCCHQQCPKVKGKDFLSHCEHWRALLFALQLVLLLLIHFYIWNEEVTEESQRAHINLVCCFVWGSPHNSWATKSNRLAYQYGWDCYILSYECPEIKLSC